jgi:DNA-binding transcriptional LysR family regulator
VEVEKLRAFLAVVEHASFTRAAEALRVGQSTVSFHVKALEAEVGTKLVDRAAGGRGGVRPTAAGRAFRRYAVRLVALREEALARLRAEERGEAGELRIAASSVPGEVLLPPVLVELRRRFPRVAVTVEVSDSRGALAKLLGEACELALLGTPIRDRRVLTTPFGEDAVVLVGAPGLDEEAPLITREEGSGTRDAVGALLARRGPGGAAPVQLGSAEAVRRAALAGLGVAFVSRRAVAEDLAAGRLRVLPLRGTPVKRRFHAARLRGVTLGVAARTLLQLLVQDGR